MRERSLPLDRYIVQTKVVLVCAVILHLCAIAHFALGDGWRFWLGALWLFLGFVATRDLRRRHEVIDIAQGKVRP